MNLFNRMKEPVFLKESNSLEEKIEKLKAIESLLDKQGQRKIKEEIKCTEYGIIGEKNIAFELKHSHLPMYVIHDLYIEDEDLNAQIDFLVVTKKLIFLIECKNLFGDIEINSEGDFIRIMDYGDQRKREGIYSPITQNQRHLELIKKIRLNSKNNIIIKLIAEKHFEDFNKSVVVLANPKTILNSRYAKKEVKDKVIRADQLVSFIKNVIKESKEMEDSDERMHSIADFYLNLHKEKELDYISKYDAYRIDKKEQVIEEDVIEEEVIKEEDEKEIITLKQENKNIEETALFIELKKYRLKKSREENTKPYFIYNDDQLKNLISKKPKTKEELIGVSGFGEMRVKKYGDDILKIVGKYI